MKYLTMFKRFLILITLQYVDSLSRKISGHVLGGDFANIYSYPHSVFLELTSADSCICGGSILNQEIVLSAAHCFDDYLGRSKDSVIIKYGASTFRAMSATRMLYYRIHDSYDEVKMFGDISLLRCKAPIKLGNTVKRVAIMFRPPHEKMAFVSGWGTINTKQELPKSLKFTQQQIQPRNLCEKYFHLPAGTFCAGPIHGPGHPSVGDSGGALMIKHFIQIGIVSFKEDDISLVVYTNTSYHYKWIRDNSHSVYCTNP